MITNRKVEDLHPNQIRFFNIEDVAFRTEDEKVKMAERVSPFFDAFEATKKSRMIELRLIIDKLDEGPITITTFNEGFIQLFENWAASCDRSKISVRDSTIIFPMDKPSNERALSLGFHTWYREGAYGPIPQTAASNYGDRTFILCMFTKNAIVEAMLPFDRDILFQDIDMVWNKDPRAFLERQAREKQIDFQFMYDGYNPRFQPLYYNSGFFYIKANDFTRAVWKVVFNHYDKVIYYRSQQAPINIIMNTYRERGLVTVRMREDLFVNGHATPIEAHKLAPELAQAAYVVHCSWTQNLEKKIDKLKLYNLWFLG